MTTLQSSVLQVFLNEAWTEVHVELDQWRIADRFEAVNLARLNDKDVASAALKGPAVYRP